MEILSKRPIAGQSTRMVLATDLDGTFLGGSATHRNLLYSWLRAQPDVQLVFVTGRDPDFIADLCAKGDVPSPEFVIGDVGTTIASFTDGRVHPLPDLEAPIAQAWHGLDAEIRARLESVTGLRLQDAPFRHRLSYEYNSAFDRAALSVLDGLEVDIIVSHGCFVDVLPKGVSKGPSLLRLISHLGLNAEQVLVAGDTLNDLSMFETGLHGALVGGSEPELLAATAHLPRAHRCRQIGAGGIIEAIHAHTLHPTPPELPL
ncbi:MAG: HAD-IIB family hydrolase [Rhodobacteraceae bacterium]|nr:HAD-IIB family hydrolase [Paracoccaceae bacterium]